jgi:hypothetical protein
LLKYFRYAFLAGAVSAAFCIVYFYVSLALGLNPLGGSKAFGYLIMVLLFFPALWYFRKEYMANELHFHQAFFLALLMNFFACVLFASFVGFYIQFLQPDFLTRHIAESKLFFASLKEDYVKTNGLEAYQFNLASLDKMTVADIVMDEFKKHFFILLFFVMVSSFMMRQSPNWANSK